ncbi:hypothetical protein Btru_005588 [Bulinus truncatus]|nr:hypothetical protein Btru_005588 [Bulinus truncatus]
MSGIWLETVYGDQNDDENKTSNNSHYIHQKLHHLLEIDVKNSVSCSSVLSELDNHLESVLMERLFQVCDKQGKGTVRVSDITDYLETIVNAPLSENGDVGNLIKILDPENLDTEVDLEIFTNGFQKWIAELKQANALNCAAIEVQADESFFTKDDNESILFFENSCEETKDDERTTLVALSSKLADSQFQYQRLTDENRELRTLLESKEEELIKICRELSDANFSIKRLYELNDILRQTQAENLELRQQIASMDGELRSETKVAQLAKLKMIELEDQMKNYEEQLARMNSELNYSVKHEEILKASLAENKEKLLNFADIHSTWETRVAEKNERIQELTNSLHEACKYCEDLKYEKQDLLEKLTETELELSSLKSVPETRSTGSLPSLVASDVEELANEIEEDIELQEDRNNECPSSICQELKQLTDERGTTNVDDFHDCKRFNLDGNRGKDPLYDISNEKLRFLYTFLKKLKEENKRLRYLSRHLIHTNFKKYSSSQSQNQPDPNLMVYVKVIDPEISFHYLIEYNTMLTSQVDKLKSNWSHSLFDVETKECYNQTNECYNQTKECYNQTKECYNQTKEYYNQTKECYNKQKNATTKQKNDTTKQENATAKQNNDTTKQKNATTKQKNATTKQKNATTKQKNATTKQKNATAKQKNATAKQKNDTTKQKNDTTKQKNATTNQ